VTHPIYDPLLSGWLYVLAAPLAPDEEPLPVVLWCLDDTGWWRVVGGVTERWLTQDEARQANAAIGREPTIRPVNVGAVLGRLGLTPFDAPPAREVSSCASESLTHKHGASGSGRVLAFKLEADE
jgi:hypothetical protein